MRRSGTFSKRFGYRAPAAAITVREDAPEHFREALVQIAREVGLSAGDVREAVCRALRRLPDANNWSESNVMGEVAALVLRCDWPQVYDIAESIWHQLTDPQEYESALNEYMQVRGIGWAMVKGEVQTRGDEIFQSTIQGARDELAANSRTTAEVELSEALHDLSRRPKPDTTGAVQHAMAALECFVRDYVSDPKPTLGDLLKAHRERLAIPKPLDAAIEKAWGFASEVGRHLREGRVPSREDAELVVTLCAGMVRYLSTRMDDARGGA